jgi:hypothetical protein
VEKYQSGNQEAWTANINLGVIRKGMVVKTKKLKALSRMEECCIV